MLITSFIITKGVPSTSPILILEKKLRNKPKLKILSERVKILRKVALSIPEFSFVENGIAVPMINTKNGKTMSVGVAPCHSACSRGGYTLPQSPGLFTMVMSIMVKPLKISIDVTLCFSKILWLNC